MLWVTRFVGAAAVVVVVVRCCWFNSWSAEDVCVVAHVKPVSVRGLSEKSKRFVVVVVVVVGFGSNLSSVIFVVCVVVFVFGDLGPAAGPDR